MEKKTSLGTIPSFVDGSNPVTEIHSFATISDNSFAVGYHNGDIGPRELGILYFSDAFGSPVALFADAYLQNMRRMHLSHV